MKLSPIASWRTQHLAGPGRRRFDVDRFEHLGPAGPRRLDRQHQPSAFLKKASVRPFAVAASAAS